MHRSAMLAGRYFFDIYCRAPGISVLDLGAMDVNGSLRSVAPSNCRYVGADLSPGKGVDVVLNDPYALPFADGQFDAIVCTSCFEHDSFFWLTFLECVRVLRTGGHFYLNVPSNGAYHTYPDDNWRFYPDAGRALVRWAQRNGVSAELVESFILNQFDGIWNDFVAVFRRSTASDSARARATSAIHTRFPGATNIWSLNAEVIARKQEWPEDQRRRRAAAS